MDGISWEAVIGLLVVVGLALLSVLGGILVKLSAIGAKVDGLVKTYDKNHDEDQADHVRLWKRSDDHETRITVIEARE